MLKTLSTESAKPGKGGVRVGGNSRAGCAGCKIDGGEVDGGEFENDEIGKKIQKTSKSKNLFKFKKTVRTDFFTPGAKLVFTELRKAFLKTPIFHHFDPERHIRIETDVSGNTIGGVFSQLTLDNLDQ